MSAAPTRDGRFLHYRELPGPPGAPTVVFEAGMGATRSSWALVQPAVAERARTIAYDRAGLGRSERDPAPRTLHRLADDLADLLDHVGGAPVVLVGHSWGGPVARVAAAADPSRVTGLVLIDPTDEACDLFFTPAFRRQERLSGLLMPPLARTGLLNVLAGRMTKALPPDARAELRAEYMTAANVDAQLAEGASTVADLTALRERPPDLGDIPVTVISGALTTGMGKRRRAAINEAHAHRAAQSPAGRHVLAERSGHLVMLTEPEVVIDEVVHMLG